jgi:hypothetical protein
MAKTLAVLPAGISKSAARWYRQTAQQFGLKTSGELGVLAEAARSLTRIEQCQAQLESDGLFVGGQRGLVSHPALRAEQQNRALFLQACRQLGVSSPSEVIE